MNCDGCYYRTKNENSTLPVSVLKDKVFTCFEQFKNDKIEEKYLFHDVAINYFPLKSNNFFNKKIEALANNEINIEECYLQYIWSCAYIFAVCQDYSCNGIIYRDIIVHRAFHLLEECANLSESSDIDLLYGLPNPSQYCILESQYVHQANICFCDTLEFLLLHECHHLSNSKHFKAEKTEDEFHKEELECDEYAGKKLLIQNKYNGVFVAVLALLINEDIRGDKEHPSPITRMKNLFKCFEICEDKPWNLWQLVLSVWRDSIPAQNDYDLSTANTKEGMEKLLKIICIKNSIKDC